MGKKTTKELPTTEPQVQMNGQSELDSQIVAVIITNQGVTKTFFLHKTVASRETPYFTALRNFREGNENEVSIEGVDHDAFYNLMFWFHRGTLDPAIVYQRGDLIKLWAAADRLLVRRCKNTVMDLLRSTHKIDTVNLQEFAILDQLGHGTNSILTRYIIDQSAHDCVNSKQPIDSFTPPLTDGMKFELAQAFQLKIIELARVWCAGRRDWLDWKSMPVDPAQLQGCQYHDHDKGEKCYVKVVATIEKKGPDDENAKRARIQAQISGPIMSLPY